MYSTVTDGEGRLVHDLPRGDFEVADNGKPQELTVFANEIQPITVVLLLDRSGNPGMGKLQQQRAARA